MGLALQFTAYKLGRKYNVCEVEINGDEQQMRYKQAKR